MPLANAIIITQNGTKPLPVPCGSAATVISSLEDFGDELSPNSFNLVFPVLAGAIIGERSTPSCDGALSVLHQHAKTDLALRRAMATAVLTLLTHDRSKAFSRPTCSEVLCRMYAWDEAMGDKPVPNGDLQPLLTSSGTLGAKACRIASLQGESIRVAK